MCVCGCVCVNVCACKVYVRKKEMQDASSDSVPRGQRHTHTHTGGEQELVLWRGKQEQTVRSHQPHHTLYYADLRVYCRLIRNRGVAGGHLA